MLARRQFRNDAAVFRVKFDLRRNNVRQHRPIAHDSSAGFIAGSFEGEQRHLQCDDLSPSFVWQLAANRGVTSPAAQEAMVTATPLCRRLWARASRRCAWS